MVSSPKKASSASSSSPLLKYTSMRNNLSLNMNGALQQTLMFCMGSAVNGALVGVTGPSLHALSANTGLGTAALGRVVLCNRIAKLVGTFIWTAYAKLVQEDRAPLAPRKLLASCFVTIGLCAAAIATYRASGLALQGALVLSGAAYGIADSAMTLLTVWASSVPTQQRSHVAMINVGFTVGALVTPAVIAGAYHWGASCYVAWTVLAAFGCLCGAAFSVSILPVCTMLPTTAPTQAGTQSTSADADRKSHEGDRRGASAGAAHSGYGSNGCVRGRKVWASGLIGAMCAVLFCVTGAEHAVATWLPTYGHNTGNVDLGEMAMMSAAYWGMICAGRLIWAAVSGALASGFPALAFDGVLMLVSAALIADFSVGRLQHEDRAASGGSSLLWVGTLGLGFGCSSSLPCAITLPSEAKVELTPDRLLALNLSGSAGEMLLPYVIGARGYLRARAFTPQSAFFHRSPPSMRRTPLIPPRARTGPAAKQSFSSRACFRGSVFPWFRVAAQGSSSSVGVTRPSGSSWSASRRWSWRPPASRGASRRAPGSGRGRRVAGTPV